MPNFPYLPTTPNRKSFPNSTHRLEVSAAPSPSWRRIPLLLVVRPTMLPPSPGARSWVFPPPTAHRQDPHHPPPPHFRLSDALRAHDRGGYGSSKSYWRPPAVILISCDHAIWFWIPRLLFLRIIFLTKLYDRKHFGKDQNLLKWYFKNNEHNRLYRYTASYVSVPIS